MSASVNKTPSGVKTISSRIEYLALFGQDAPPPEFTRPPQYWFLEPGVLPSSARRYDYVAVALGDGSFPIYAPSVEDPSPERRAFYVDYEMRKIPIVEARQVTRGQALQCNLPWDVNPAGNIDPEYNSWLHSGVQETPMVPLEPGEAFAPSLFGGVVGVVNMAQYRIENPTTSSGKGFTDEDRSLLRQIAAKVGITAK